VRIEVLTDNVARFPKGLRVAVHPRFGDLLIGRGDAAEVLPTGKLRRRRGRPKGSKADKSQDAEKG